MKTSAIHTLIPDRSLTPREARIILTDEYEQVMWLHATGKATDTQLLRFKTQLVKAYHAFKHQYGPDEAQKFRDYILYWVDLEPPMQTAGDQT